MILFADSGSTKTDWLVTDQQGVVLHSFQGKGINPMIQEAWEIAQIAQETTELNKLSSAIKDVWFFGAGCSEAGRIEKVASALKAVMPNAEVAVDHDLTGAVYALCGDRPGFACILGTGSNSVLFDGKSQLKKVPSLGWALGDEASGAWFGKRLLRDFCYLQLPENIAGYLDKEQGLDKEAILQAVYAQPNPNRYLAGFMPVLGTFRGENYVQSLLEEGFSSFIRYHIACYDNYTNYPANFVGSVALHFREELEHCCTNFGLDTGKFVHRPIEEIAAFLIKKKQV